MEDIFRRLSGRLLEINEQLSPEQARTWIEHFWEDFEATRAKSGREYKGAEVTESIVRKWIEQYGPHLHRYQATNRKFNNLEE
ncbi:hypothetical protein D7Z54_19465 [Salibacterium salarium]|uniref:WVELL protein n=1 Tax=Salibacterium salarium TaxID=284579 RepID=A0A428MZV2_9BACI|nr:YfhJ family protein [Salibacterium salarium]RSL31626.1 hypothetical protein D7Z54_19465 [Salibacterium salarium]